MSPLFHKKNCKSCSSQKIRALWGFYPIWLCSNEKCSRTTGIWSDLAFKNCQALSNFDIECEMTQLMFRLYTKNDNYLKMLYKSVFHQNHE